MKKDPYTAHLHVKMTPKMKEAIEKMASEQDKNTSELTRHIFTELILVNRLNNMTGN